MSAFTCVMGEGMVQAGRQPMGARAAVFLNSKGGFAGLLVIMAAQTPTLFYSGCFLGQKVRTSQPNSSVVQDNLRLVEGASMTCQVLTNLFHCSSQEKGLSSILCWEREASRA